MSGRVATFYSFKGGVGRTQALANVAVALASRGRVVVLVDMDMESPGLHTYFQPPGESRRLRNEDVLTDGVLEWLEACSELPSRVPAVSYMEVSHPLTRGNGRLLLVPSGRLLDRYAERLAAFSWEHFYEKLDGFRYIELLRSQFLALGGGADLVLVDSRTGFTDAGSVCTFQLPDSVLLFFTPHRQGIDGVAHMARAIVQRREQEQDIHRAQRVLFVPSKVDRQGPETERALWLEEMHLRLDGVADELLGDDDLVEYSSASAWGETVLDPQDVNTPLVRAYRGLADRLDAGALTLSASPPFVPDEEVDTLPRLSEMLSTLSATYRSLDWESGTMTDVARWAASVRAEHAALWKRTRRHALGVAGAARSIGHPSSLAESLSEPSTLTAWEQVLVQLGNEGERTTRAWQEHVREKLRGAVDDPSLVDELLRKLEGDFARWRTRTVETRVAGFVDDLPDQAARRRVESGALTLADFRQWIPLDERRAWILQQTQAWLDKDWGQASNALKNLLSLLVDEPNAPPEVTHWTAYDVLCDSDREIRDDALNYLGARLWVASWSDALHRGEPGEVARASGISPDARRRFEQLRARPPTNPPAGYESAARKLRDELVRRHANMISRATARTFVAVNSSDPLLRVSLRVGLPASPTPVLTTVGEFAASVTLERIRKGGEFDGGVAEAWLLWLIADRAWITEAYEALLKLRDLYGAVTPSWATSVVTARCLLLFLSRGHFDAAAEVAQGEDCWNWATATSSGTLVLAMIGAHLAPGQPMNIARTTSIRARLVRCDGLPPRLGDWLLALHTNSHDLYSVLDDVATLWSRTRKLAEPTNFFAGWARSAEYHREFVDWWRRRLNEVEVDSRESDAIVPGTLAAFCKGALHDLAKKLGGRPPDGGPVNSFLKAFDDVRDSAVETVRARGSGARWTIREALDADRLRSDALAALHAHLQQHADGAAAWVYPVLADMLHGNAPIAVAGGAALWQADPDLLFEPHNDSPLAFLDNLLSLSVGERTYESAAESLAGRGYFGSAGALARKVSPPAFDALLTKLGSEWERFVAPTFAQREHWVRAVEDLREEAIDTILVDEALRDFDTLATVLPQPGLRLTLGDLVRIGDERPRELQRMAGMVGLAITYADADRQKQRAAAIAGLKLLRVEMDELCDRWLWSRELDADRARHFKSVFERFGRLFAAQDRGRAALLVQETKAWLEGEGSPPDIDGTTLPTPLPARLPSIPPPAVEAHSVRQVFPSRIEAALREAAQQQGGGVEGDLVVAALETEDPVRLRAIAARASAMYTTAQKTGEQDVEARAAFLVGWGRVALCRDDGFDSIVFFIEALRQVPHMKAPPQIAERYQTLCVWGILLALMLPHLTNSQRDRVQQYSNLAALFRRPPGLMPLGYLDHLGIWDEIAEAVIELGGSGAVLFEMHLLPFLRVHPRAAVAFFRGLATLLRARPDSASTSFARWLAATLDDQGASHAELPTTNQDALLRAARGAVESRYEDTDVGREVLDVFTRRLEAQPTAAGSVVQSLATPEVPVAPGAHVAIRLSREQDPPLLRVRSVAALHDQSGANVVRGSLGDHQFARVDTTPTEAIFGLNTTVPPGEYKLEVVHTRRTLDGSRVAISTKLKNFAVRLLAVNTILAVQRNPYVYKLAVKTANGRYGRRGELERVKLGLMGRTQDNAVLILGPRRIGKTTLLYALRDDEEIKRRYFVVFIDLQYVAESMPAWRFYLTHLIEPIQKAATDQGVLVPSPLEERLKRNPHEAFRDFIDMLDRRLKARQKRALLLLDELDRLVVRFAQSAGAPQGEEPIAMEILGTLRSAIQLAENVSFLLAGAEEYLNPLLREHGGRLFQLTLEVRLKPLPDKDARDLIEGPARGVVDYTADAISKILDVSARQPSLIQTLCHEVYERVTARRAKVATLSDAEAAIHAALKMRESFLHLQEVLQDSPTSLDDQRLVRVIAEAQRDPRWVFLRDIERAYRLQGLRSSRDDLRDQLRRLTDDLPYIVERNEDRAGLYRITVPLFALYLRRESPDAWLPDVRG